MRVLGAAHFGTGDVPALLRRLRDRHRLDLPDPAGDPRPCRTRRSPAAKAAVPRWFGRAAHGGRGHPRVSRVPPARGGRARRTPRRRTTGAGPGSSGITNWQPERISRASLENAAFHEAIPAFTSRTPSPRSDARRIRSPGTSTSPASAKAGRCTPSGWPTRWVSTRETWTGWVCWPTRAGARRVWSSTPASAPTGWTRQQAVELLTAHSTLSPSAAEGGGGSINLVAGASTAYMLGSLTIRAIAATPSSGWIDVDIREFHDAAARRGTITLPMLQERMELGDRGASVGADSCPGASLDCWPRPS